MKKIKPIYDEIILKSIVYENGDAEAELNCQIKYRKKAIDTKLIVSQTDVNRLLSKMACQGFDLNDKKIEFMDLDDGTQVIEYSFNENNLHSIYNFQFNNTYTQIGA